MAAKSTTPRHVADSMYFILQAPPVATRPWLGRDCGENGDAARVKASVARRPGIVIARHARPLLGRLHGTARPICPRRAGQIGHMRLLPLARDIVFRARRDIDAMMQPASNRVPEDASRITVL